MKTVNCNFKYFKNIYSKIYIVLQLLHVFRSSVDGGMRRLYGSCIRLKNITQAHAYVVCLFEQNKIRADVGEVPLHIRELISKLTGRVRYMSFVYVYTMRRHLQSDVFRIHHVYFFSMYRFFQCTGDI